MKGQVHFLRELSDEIGILDGVLTPQTVVQMGHMEFELELLTQSEHQIQKGYGIPPAGYGDEHAVSRRQHPVA